MCLGVRKHRAPKGALRLHRRHPSAYRREQVRKHRAPKGALRPKGSVATNLADKSESTERQKVH